MNKINSITVFCGSSSGNDAIFCNAAENFGKLLADKKIHLIYGGASIGVMGACADAVLKSGGEVTGIIPTFLSTKEIAHHGLTKLIHVASMHERKALMHQMADGFVVLPGGIGTLEEFFEILTWAQLGLHQKPIAILNVQNYFNHLIEFIDQMVEKGFLKMHHKNLIIVVEDAEVLLQKMTAYVAPKSDIILNTDQL